MRVALGVVSVALTLAACAATRSEKAPLLEGTGKHGRIVSTDVRLAQRYFDQGLTLCYAFNFEEAVRSFEEAARLDPDLAIAWWGKSFALGNNINRPLDEEHAVAAWEAIGEATARRDHASEVERDLIDAMAARFAMPPPDDRAHLDRAYADAMRRLFEKYPDDDDVAVLYGDALMNTRPWDHWTSDFQPRKHTLEMIAALEHALKLNVDHPGANHLYIHAVEASGDPGRAEPAADRLGSLAPGLGHIVHMPAHIYVQVGRFEEAIRVNETARHLDLEYLAKFGVGSDYHFSLAHNNHFRVWTAMYMGDYEHALEACRVTLDDLPDELEGEVAAAEWLPMESHVHLRFGNWEAVLASPGPREDQPYAVALWRYARGIALANTGRIEEARTESQAFEEEVARVPDEQMVFIISAFDVLDIAREMLAGEIAYKAGDYDLSFERLRAAVAAENALLYLEPSPWLMPTRHALGALLLDRGLVAEAEEIYRQDLRRHPRNVWSLHGLTECLERRGKMAEAAEVRAQLENAEARATVDVSASCYCRDTRRRR